MNNYKLCDKVRTFNQKVSLINDFNLEQKPNVIYYFYFKSVLTVMKDSTKKKRASKPSRQAKAKQARERYHKTKADDPDAFKKML